MVKKEGPWGNNEPENPWEQDNSQPAPEVKVVKFGKPMKPQGIDINFSWLVPAVILLWLLSGFYQVQTNEEGVVLRFGKYQETTPAGLHYHLPYPIETVEKVNITQERSITLGVNEAYNTSNIAGLRAGKAVYNNAANSSLSSFTESHMLTGDENIVDINLTIVWKIKDAKDFLFNMRNPEETVRVAAQSVLREIVGQSEMQPIITGDRGKVEDETKEELQKVLDEFGSGVQIVRVKLQKADPPKQVVDAFNEVQRAKADMERFKNEAEAYRNEILPIARGVAAQKLQDAQAYQEAVVNKARGEADRFNSVYKAYTSGKDVTIKRLYLETMENVLKNSDTIIIDSAPNSTGVLPYLPLDRMKKNPAKIKENKE